MAAFSFGTQFSPLHRLKYRPHLSSSPKPFPSLRYLPSFGSPFCRIRVPRLAGYGVLARAEDKAKASSRPHPPAVQEQAESNNEKQLQELNSPSGSCDPICSVDETSSHDLERTYCNCNNLPRSSQLGSSLGGYLQSPEGDPRGRHSDA